MNTQTDEKKIMTAQAQSQLNEQYFACKAQFINAEYKHWTSGSDHKPIKDEIIVHEADGKSHVLIGIEYDVDGNVGMVYKTDAKGKRTNLNITVPSPHINENILAKHFEEAGKKIKAPAKTAESAEKKAVKPIKKTGSKARPMQVEQRA